MKKIVLVAFAILCVLKTSFGQKTPAQAVISFNSETVDFGKIAQGNIVDTIFRFKNTGNAPLHVAQAKGSCGCTRPTWPDKPILPGQTGEIGVRFNSAKRSGDQTKTITIESDATQAVVLLKLIGFVVAPKISAEDSLADVAARHDTTKIYSPNRPHEIEAKISKPVGLTTIELDEKSFDFGKVEEGTVVKHTFSYKNTGDQVFFMSSLRDNCNCLTLNYDEATLVQPGKSASFEVVFDTAGQAGEHNKKILVGGNLNEQEIPITLKGKVKKK